MTATERRPEFFADRQIPVVVREQLVTAYDKNAKAYQYVAVTYIYPNAQQPEIPVA